MLTQQELKMILEYHKDTGLFTWIKCDAPQIKPGSVAGRINNRGYRSIKINGKLHSGHRLVWLYVFGNFPENHIDHIDHDKANNRIENLREVTRSGNMQNYVKANSSNRLGLLGVSKCGSKFQSEIKVFGVRKYLGRFDTPELAHAAYISAKRELHPTGTL